MQENKVSLKQKYNIPDRMLEEFIEEDDFIMGKDYVDFLAQHGYNIIGFCRGEIKGDEVDKTFLPLTDRELWLDHMLILISNQEHPNTQFSGIYCEQIEGNPYVKRISLSLTEFEIRTVEKFKRWEKVEKDNVYAYVTSGKLEKGLSMEWIKFLASRYIEYEEYILDRYKWVKFNAVANKQSVDRLIARRVGEIENELTQASKEQQKIIDKSDYIINMITSGK